MVLKMKKYYFKIIALIFFSLFLFIVNVNATEFSGGIMFGYSGGTSFQLDGMVGNFAEGFPLKMQLALVYSRVNPGSAWDSSRV